MTFICLFLFYGSINIGCYKVSKDTAKGIADGVTESVVESTLSEAAWPCYAQAA
jgi:hypothetical protein